MGDWRWKLYGEDGSDMRTTEAFASKEEAEAWMGSNWQSLADEGAGSVSLLDGDKIDYKMSLHEG